ncbi:LysE family transporter [Amycolatopsis rhabdoformis]|uniref:LysE family transporter n=1 Tax=Amycolatopsis rhabdoformis TaxID=1448059 RepID=A0ABZ1IP09_9PSEU|nr:LysE family transporter [Amycolatopsis rhabdoformis]WSE35411.1 LysE family transporter [Amycolatopsis rhabdoformis]
MTAPVVAGALAGYGIAVPVGAIGAVLVGLAARTSPRVAAAAALGVASADGVYAALAVTGGAALTPVLAPVAGPLRWASVVVLVALAAHTAVSAWRRYRAGDTPRAEAPPPSAARAYASFLGLTLLNPATVVYFTALVVGGTATGSGALFALAAFAASASWQLLLAGGGVLLGRVLAGRRGRLTTALVSSAVIVALAVRLVLPE